MTEATATRWGTWIALRLVRGVGPVVYQGLLRAFGEPAAVLAASTHALECAGIRPELARAIRQFDGEPLVDRQLARMARCGAQLLTWHDDAYPPNLRHIHDPPPFLFVRGELQATDAVAVAVVGSRQASPYALRMAREIATGLAQHGVTVVSGMARGIDADAHWSTLRGGGRTIAVLGSGIDVIYPSEHHSLFQAITRQGAVMTELLMGTQPDAENFPARNRIISGLALGTVVVEAAEKSGSLITARLAAEQGREVFAVPGMAGERTRGTHRLLRDGAKLTESAADVLEEIAPPLAHQRVQSTVALTDIERTVLAAVQRETLHVDVIIGRTGLPAAAVLPTLLTMELKGVLQQLPGKHFAAAGIDLRAPREQE